MVIAILVLSILVNMVLGYGLYNMVKKQELLEDFILAIQEKTKQVLTNMRNLDQREMFEKDDDVGIVFANMVELTSQLESFLGIENTEENI